MVKEAETVIEDFNAAVVAGRIVEAPTLKYAHRCDGIGFGPICRFVIESRIRRDTPQGVTLTETIRHRIVAIGDRAEWCYDHLGVGMRARVEGRIKIRRAENRDGTIWYIPEVIATNVEAR